MQSQLDTFRSNLEEFAAKHKNEIKKNAEFRQHFQQMCARIGVDPLACKYIWDCLYLSVSLRCIYMSMLFQQAKAFGQKCWVWEISTMRQVSCLSDRPNRCSANSFSSFS